MEEHKSSKKRSWTGFTFSGIIALQLSFGLACYTLNPRTIAGKEFDSANSRHERYGVFYSGSLIEKYKSSAYRFVLPIIHSEPYALIQGDFARRHYMDTRDCPLEDTVEALKDWKSYDPQGINFDYERELEIVSVTSRINSAAKGILDGKRNSLNSMNLSRSTRQAYDIVRNGAITSEEILQRFCFDIDDLVAVISEEYDPDILVVERREWDNSSLKALDLLSKDESE